MFHGLQAESHWSSDQLCLSDTAGNQAKGVNIVLLPKLMGKILWWILKVLHERAKVQGGKTPEGGLRHRKSARYAAEGQRHQTPLKFAGAVASDRFCAQLKHCSGWLGFAGRCPRT